MVQITRFSRSIHRLNDRYIQKAKDTMLCDGGGLYLHSSKTGAKSWIFRYRVNGRLRDNGLGSYATISLLEAREKARDCRQLRLQGKDPIEHKKRLQRQQTLNDAKHLTFADCADKYIMSHKASWKNAKHAQQWHNTLERYAYPFIATVPIADISVDMIMRIIQPIWASKNETASRLRGRIEVILDWARAYGMRDGDNPARWRGNLEHLLPARKKVSTEKHHCAMPYQELPALWQAVRFNYSYSLPRVPMKC